MVHASAARCSRRLLTENGWIEQVDSRVIQYAGFYEKTQNIVNDWLTRYGDDLDCIWCPWDEPAMAASEAIVSKGLQDKIFVVGADGHPTALQRMRDGGEKWPQKSTCAQAFELWGAYCGWLVNEIVGKGGDAKKLVPVPIVEFPAPLLVSGRAGRRRANSHGRRRTSITSTRNASWPA